MRRTRVGGTCPICGAHASLHCKKGRACYFKCAECDALFQWPLPTLGEMVEYAEREYQGGMYTRYVRARDLKQATFRARMAAIRDRAGSGRLMDLGCSCGYFIECALQEGFDAHGVEFSAEAIAVARPEIRERIFHGDVNELTQTHLASYDVVTAFDIIEHTFEPLELLSSVRGLLRKGGLLAVTTPDTGHFLRFLMGARWPMLQPHQHTVLFSRQSLMRALRTTGYTDVEVLTAQKVLTADYLVGQIEVHNPWIARLYRTMSCVIPRGWRRLPMSVNIGEIMAFGRRSD